MKKSRYQFIFLLAITWAGCTTKTQVDNAANSGKMFSDFENIFLDAYWKHYPSASILIGYGKYYDNLVIPDSSAILNNISFSNQWLDSLNKMDYNYLSNNDKISFKIIQNQLESDSWYQSVFKQYEWDASIYNLSGECYYIINQPYALLDERLKTLTKHLQNAEVYFQSAFKILHQPTREHIELAILQNQGGLSVFGTTLTDSIKTSHLNESEKIALNQNVLKAVGAIKNYINSLKNLLSDKKYVFRSFRIGKELFAKKFNYDLAVNLTPEELYNKAIADKKNYYSKMYHLADSLWFKYCKNQNKPTDTLTIIQSVIDKISLQHSEPEHFFDTLTTQVYQLKKFIITKNLFDFDTIYPIKVRIMPAYARGVSVASADFSPPYQTNGETYYNIDDLTEYSKEKAASVLREYNNYSSQLLSIHEAIPGHCLQGIYNNKAHDKLRSVFTNGAMIEGWAVYVESMLLENGWGNYSPEIELMHDKLKLRELANVIIDYDIQCLNKPKEYIMQLLVKECFQTNAQAEEKYHRATVSQVQLCSYYAGSSSIQSLRDEYEAKMGDAYSLKDFHEKFLTFGSAPIKFIRELMLKKC